MHKILLGSLALFVATGCSSQSVTFDHQSKLEVSTRGVALAPGGDSGQAGMMGTTCAFDTEFGGIAEDYDFPGNSEQVQDAGTMLGDVTVLVVSDHGVHLTFPDQGWAGSTQDVTVDGTVLQGRIFDQGVAAISEGADCAVSWVDVEQGTSTTVSADLCGGDFTVDTATGTAFVANGRVAIATPEGEQIIEGLEANLVVWDSSADVLYAALAGDTIVHALEADGSTRWTVDVTDPIVTLEGMGALAAAGVMLDGSGAAGRFLVLDAFTGEIRAELNTPTVASDVVVDSHGRTMAMVLPDAVHLFRLGSL